MGSFQLVGRRTSQVNSVRGAERAVERAIANGGLQLEHCLGIGPVDRGLDGAGHLGRCVVRPVVDPDVAGGNGIGRDAEVVELKRERIHAVAQDERLAVAEIRSRGREHLMIA